MLDEEGFCVGDVVVLKSGGPVMTIRTAKAHRGDYFTLAWWELTCVWFDSANRLQESVFSSVELLAAEEDLTKQQGLRVVPYS